jgi:hypothetical protein
VPEVEVPSLEELEERRDKAFTRRVALTTAVYAVVLAIASLGGNNAMKEMLLAQQQSSDQWAFYQAKVIREHLYRAQKLMLDATLAADGPALPAANRARLEALSRRFSEEEQRYATEKKDVERDAKKLEHERDVNRARDPYFDYAEVLLQIAIVTASVSILASSRPVFAFSAVLAIVGTVLAVNGFALVLRLPFLHGH